MLNTNIINNQYTTNTINLIKTISELGNQPTQTIITTSPEAQESTPKYTKTQKITKTPKNPTISISFKSLTTQHGYFVPSKKQNIITHTSYNTTLSINALTRGYTMGCTINGVQQMSAGDIYYTNWMLKGLQPNDVVEVTLIGGESTKTIIYTINGKGVMANVPQGINHPATINGTHSATLDIQDKYRKAATQQTVEAPAPAQEVPAQIEEVVAPVVAQEEQIINFGKHAGKSLSSLDSSYLKWLVSHESRLSEANRWVCIAAKSILSQEKAA